VVPFVSAVAFAVFLAVAVWIARLDRGGPAHADLALDGGVRATLYVPGADAGAGRSAFLDPPPPEERAPAVVVMHGFAGDRLSMSGISRRIAASGYAVLNIDATGHGQNRNPFARSWATSDAFHEDMRAAVDFLRSHPFVDGSRLAVMGHSMGAGAALDYATRDAALDAAVMISGGWRLEGPYSPANALFIYADGDPDRVRVRSDELAARLAGVAQPQRDHTYGRHDRHDAVRVVEVAGANHQTIVWTEDAVREIVAWLDAAFGVKRASAPTPADPRAPALALLGIVFVLVLPGLGLLVGRLAPAAASRPGEGRGLGLVAVAAAFALTMPLLATGTPAEILSVEVADVLVAHFALAGIVLLVAVRLRRPELLDGLFGRPGTTLLCAGLGVIGVFVLMQPFAVVMHRVTLTPERMAVFLMATLGFLPLALAFNLLLRRGPTASATLFAVAGRVLVLLVLVAGIRAGILAEVLLFMLPALASVSLLFEVFASSVYAASRNLLAIAVVDAAWLAIVAAAIMPIRV
jgi:dienelactone hydrolase